MATELAELRQQQAVQEERMETMRAERQTAFERVLGAIAQSDRGQAERDKALAEREALRAKEQADRETQRAKEQAARDKALAEREAQRAKEQAERDTRLAKEQAVRDSKAAEQDKEQTRLVVVAIATAAALIGLLVTMGFGVLGIILSRDRVPVVINHSPPALSAPAAAPLEPRGAPAQAEKPLPTPVRTAQRGE